MEEIIVQIDWEGPLTLDQIGDLNNPQTDVGIYAIYGPHVLYGDYTLVYIGKTWDGFGRRILKPDHPGVPVDGRTETRVHIGRVQDATEDVFKRCSMIQQAESLLIYAHAPAYNSHGIADPPSPPLWRFMRIVSRGERGLILAEVVGTRFYNCGEKAGGAVSGA